MAKKTSLGKGLGALIDDSKYEQVKQQAVETENINEIELSKIEVNPFQPRKHFNQTALNELADSIKAIGIIQPITVTKIEDDKYRIISGERRFRASQIAELKKVPVFIRETDDQGLLEMALIENIQREDLNAIEVAMSYQRLIDECNLKQEELGQRIGKSRSAIANFLRLLKLPGEIQIGIRDRLISMGHARALVTIEDKKLQKKLYFRIVNEGLNVREIERIIKELKEPKENDKKKKPEKQNHIPENYNWVQDNLHHHFKTNVDFTRTEKGTGKITIQFNNDEELSHIVGTLDRLNHS